MTNYTMMTMATPTSRSRRLVKMLERLIKQDHLYSDDELKLMKNQLRVIKEELALIESKTSKGFK